MNPQEINKRIGIACGVEPVLEGWWAKKDDSICLSAPTKAEVQDWIDRLPEGSWAKDYVATPFYRYPNYHGDLNAMHEAEIELVRHGENSAKFNDELDAICMTDWLNGKYESPRSIHAKATQRAEAFLRTIGQWEENKGEQSPSVSKNNEIL
jgi:hypothetical protein